MSVKVLILVNVKLELAIILIDCVVSQVHASIGQVFFVGSQILFSCQSADSLLVDKNSQRVAA